MVSKIITRFNPIILAAVLNSSMLSRWSLLIAKPTLVEEITFYTHFHAALSFQPVLNPENVTRFVVTAPESIRLEGHELFMDIFYNPPQVSLLQPLLSRLSERGWAPQRIGGGPPPEVKIQRFDWQTQAPTQSPLASCLGLTSKRLWPARSKRKALIPVAYWLIRTLPFDRCCSKWRSTQNINEATLTGR